MESSLDLIFDPSENSAYHWGARSGLEHALDLRTAEQLYTRALPYIKNWAWALAAKHGWTEEAVDAVGDMPLAVCLGRDELVQGVNGDRTYVARLVLPLHFADFLDPEFSNDWAAMFSHLMTSYQSESASDSADIFQLGRAGIPRPLQNILYLLQILSPGLLVVRSLATDDYEDEDGEWVAQGLDLALPPSIWVGLHIEDLEDIFGAQTALKLYQAAEDPYCASEETSSYDSSYGSQGAFEQFSDSSDSAFAFDSSEDDWSSMDAPLEFGQEDNVYLQYTVPYSHSKEDKVIHDAQPDMSNFDKHEYNHLISDMDGGKALDMEYRHCDSDCNFCGLCSSHFANRLSERLLMHVL